jgi:aconitate hydratase
MGVLPLQFQAGESAATYHLDGTETISIKGLDALNRGETVPTVSLRATRTNGEVVTFDVRLRIDTPTEAEYFRHGGVLNFVLRHLAQS